MTDERLVESSDLQLERALLRAAAEEAPPAAARVRALGVLGLLGVASAAHAAAASTAGAGTAVAPTVSTTGFAGWHWLLKWSLVVGLGGAAVGGGIAIDRTLHSPETTPVEVLPVAPPTTTPVVRHAPRPSPSATNDEVVANEDDGAATEDEDAAAPAPPGTAGRKAPTTPGAASSIRAEVQLLDRARAALTQGAPDTALALLSSYSARFPKGALREEAAVLRIKALRAQGSDRAAEREQRRFQERYPGSAHRVGEP